MLGRAIFPHEIILRTQFFLLLYSCILQESFWWQELYTSSTLAITTSILFYTKVRHALVYYNFTNIVKRGGGPGRGGYILSALIYVLVVLVLLNRGRGVLSIPRPWPGSSSVGRPRIVRFDKKKYQD